MGWYALSDSSTSEEVTKFESLINSEVVVGFFHIHASYQNYKAAFSIETSNMIVGDMPTKQRKLIEAWIELHREDIIKNHELMMQGKKVDVIEGF